MLKNWILTLTTRRTGVCRTGRYSARRAQQRSTDRARGPLLWSTDAEDDSNPDRRADMLTKQLNLSADQKTKVADIFKSEQEQMQKIHADASASQQDRRRQNDGYPQGVRRPDSRPSESRSAEKWDEMQAQRDPVGQGTPQPPPTAASTRNGSE